MPSTQDLMLKAWEAGRVVPAFNIPYLPMMEPVVRALRDTGAFGLVDVARLEFTKFAAGSPRAFYEEWLRVRDERFARLHLDHVPVIDEDGLRVDYAALIGECLDLGFQSVMVDGSRLPLEENIAATREVVDMAHAAGVPAEAELGAILGHEEGPLPPYEELFASGRGFTDPGEARRFVEETGVDWLSVAIGNVHGAISAATRGEKKIAARLDLEHLKRLQEAAGVPLVLHGGSGIPPELIRAAVKLGIAKINVATTLRQAYEPRREESIAAAQEAVYEAAVGVIVEELEMRGEW